MPRQAWTARRERQYDHITGDLEARRRPKELATQLAARTVNKERARSGEADTSSRSSTRDLSSVRRGGLRSPRGTAGRTKVQLNEEARRKGVEGRAQMSKAQLEHASAADSR